MAVLDKQGEIQEFLKGDGFWMARQCNAQTHSVHDSEYALDLIAAYGSFTWAKGQKYFKSAAGRPTYRVSPSTAPQSPAASPRVAAMARLAATACHQ